MAGALEQPDAVDRSRRGEHQLHQHVPLLDGLAEPDGQASDAAADFGFDHRLELRLHGADDLLHGGLLYGFDGLQADHSGRQVFAGRGLGFMMLAATCDQGDEAQEEEAEQTVYPEGIGDNSPAL